MNSKNDQTQSNASDEILNELHRNEQNLYKQLVNSNLGLFTSSKANKFTNHGPYNKASQSESSTAPNSQSFNHSDGASQQKPKATTNSTPPAHHSDKVKSNHNHKFYYVIGAIAFIVIITLGLKILSAPTPTTPKGYASYERARIVRNIHKNEPRTTVNSTSADHQGTLKIHTNLTTTNPRKVKQIWNHIYDRNGNNKYDCDDVELYGTNGLLCEGDAQDSHHVNYGSVTQHNNKLPGGEISNDNNEN